MVCLANTQGLIFRIQTINAGVCWLDFISTSLPFCWLLLSPKLHFSDCQQKPGPLLLNFLLLQTSAVSNLAPWPTSPFLIYLHILPIASASLSFPSFPALSIFSSPPYQLPSLPLSPLSFYLAFSICTVRVLHISISLPTFYIIVFTNFWWKLGY